MIDAAGDDYEQLRYCKQKNFCAVKKNEVYGFGAEKSAICKRKYYQLEKYEKDNPTVAQKISYATT
jgi:hypothetical protein